MKLSSIGLALGLAGLGIAANSMSARALDFSFSFNVSNGTTTETISGVILGVDSTGVAKNGVYITSAPGLNISSNEELTSTQQIFSLNTNGSIASINSNVAFEGTDNDGSDPNENTEIEFDYNSPGGTSTKGYYNTITDSNGTEYFSSTAGSLVNGGTKNTQFPLSTYNFQQIPWEFNPGEMVGLGVPLMMGLGVLKKKLALR